MYERKPVFPHVIEMNYQAGHVIGCNIYLVFDGNEWILIDVGYEESVDEIVELIRQLDFRFPIAEHLLQPMPMWITSKDLLKPSNCCVLELSWHTLLLRKR